MEDFSQEFPVDTHDFESCAGIPDRPLFTAREWEEHCPDNPLVCIEDAESYVMAYVPKSRAKALVEIINIGLEELERRRVAKWAESEEEREP